MTRVRLARVRAALDPESSLVEVLVALVLALGLITGVRVGILGSITSGATAALVLLTALVWGLIDGGLHLVGVKLHYGHLDQIARELRAQPDLTREERRGLVAEAFSALDSAGPSHLVGRAYDSLADALVDGPASRRLAREDWTAAVALLGWSVVVTAIVAIPLVLPFAQSIALGAAQFVGMGLLFVAGHLWARRTRYNRVRAGLALAAIGAGMFLFTVVVGIV